MKCAIAPIVAIGLTIAQPSLAADSKHWVDETQKIVSVATNPVLKITLVKLEVDDEYYGRLDISLNYDSKDMKAQADRVMASYPGYRFRRVILEKQGPYVLKVPALQLDRAYDPRPGVEGPYLEETTYLTRKQFGVLEKDFAASRPVAEINGRLVGTVSVTKVLERKEVSSAICDELLSDDRSVNGLLSRYGRVVRRALDQLGVIHESTRAALEKDIQGNCFELNGSRQVDSFEDILAIRLKAKNIRRKLIGESVHQVSERQEIPLVYETIQTGPK